MSANEMRFSLRYLYKRLRFLGNKLISHFITLAFVALWHGIAPGFFLCFIGEFVIIVMEQQVAIEMMQIQRYFHILIRIFLKKFYLRSQCFLVSVYDTLETGSLTGCLCKTGQSQFLNAVVPSPVVDVIYQNGRITLELLYNYIAKLYTQRLCGSCSSNLKITIEIPELTRLQASKDGGKKFNQNFF